MEESEIRNLSYGRGDVSSSEAARLADVLDAYLRHLESGKPPSADDVIARHPDLEDALRPYLALLDELHGAARSFGASAPPAAEPSDDSGRSTGMDRGAPRVPAEREIGVLGDFRILREVGRGGMGIVYEAEQLSLNRRVALKVLPFAAVLDGRQRQRFQSEAQAAARLHHTHIVPVYGVGCERGVYYYAMQLIDGKPLSAVIAELRAEASDAADPETPSRATRSLKGSGSTSSRAFFHAVAELGAHAADALEHAHGQGIVHRDIKPSNLMVGDDGHVWVTDFGLARLEGDGGATATGSLLGTLRYMSPEQARAAHDLVDHRTDVYSLGVTLYELATLRPAFPGDDPRQLLHRVANEEPPAPRRIQPRLPVEFETVLLKAMAKESSERYPTARELAEDLRRLLADRPVLARRPTFAQHVTKWTRRHRELVTGGVVFLVLAVVGLALGLAHVWREKQAAEEARTMAEGNYDKARRAVDRMLFRASSELAAVPGLERLRRELLEDALAIHAEFLAENDSDPTRRQEAGRSWHAVARIRRALGMHAEAMAAQGRAVELARALVDEFPDHAEHRRNLARALHNLGDLLLRQQRFDEAEPLHEEAMELVREVLQTPAGTAEDRVELAVGHLNLGVLHAGRQSAKEAEDHYRKGLEILRAAMPELEDTGQARENLGVTCSNLAALLDDQGRDDEAEALLREAITVQREAIAAGDTSGKARRLLAGSHVNLGALQMDSRRMKEAEESLSHARELLSSLVQDAPHVPEHRYFLAMVHHNLGVLVARSGGSPEDIESHHRRALELRQELVDRFGENRTYREELALSHERLAYLAKEAEDHAEAVDHWQRVDELLEPLIPTAGPRASMWLQRRAEALHELGEARLALGATDGAREVFEASLVLFERLASERPEQRVLHEMLQHLDFHLMMLTPTGDPAAETVYARLLEHLRAGLERRITAQSHGEELAGSYNDVAWLLAVCPVEKLRDPAEAVELAERAVREAPRIAAVWSTLGAARYRNGDFGAAEQALRRAIDLQGGSSPYVSLFLALALAAEGNRAEAVECYQHAVNLAEDAPPDPILADVMAEAARSLGL